MVCKTSLLDTTVATYIFQQGQFNVSQADICRALNKDIGTRSNCPKRQVPVGNLPGFFSFIFPILIQFLAKFSPIPFLLVFIAHLKRLVGVSIEFIHFKVYYIFPHFFQQTFSFFIGFCFYNFSIFISSHRQRYSSVICLKLRRQTDYNFFLFPIFFYIFKKITLLHLSRGSILASFRSRNRFDLTGIRFFTRSALPRYKKKHR